MRMVRKRRKKGFGSTLPARSFCRSSARSTDPVFSLRMCLQAKESRGVLDIGATISVVSAKIVPRYGLKRTMSTALFHMGEGHVVHSCGDCEVEVSMSLKRVHCRFHGMVTETFDFVLVTDLFTEHPPVISPTSAVCHPC